MDRLPTIFPPNKIDEQMRTWLRVEHWPVHKWASSWSSLFVISIYPDVDDPVEPQDMGFWVFVPRRCGVFEKKGIQFPTVIMLNSYVGDLSRRFLKHWKAGLLKLHCGRHDTKAHFRQWIGIWNPSRKWPINSYWPNHDPTWPIFMTNGHQLEPWTQ